MTGGINTSNTSIGVCVSVCSRKLEEEGEAASAFDQFVEDAFLLLFSLLHEITGDGQSCGFLV